MSGYSGETIRKARLERGWSQAQLARIAGTSQQTVARLELGQNERSGALSNILRLLNLNVSGDEPLMREVPIVGVLGAGAEIFSVDDHEQGAGLDTVHIPAATMGKDAVGVIVRGDSMEPAFSDGDVVFYDTRHTVDFAPIYGKMVVARLVDGRTYLKKLSYSQGVLMLLSLNGEPIVSPVIEWAAQVRFVKKG